jgi:hypothetical protein
VSDSDTRLVVAAYTAETVTVYQAYSPLIAEPAVRAGRFVPPFSRGRMTWIKPSFGWMMHRCGWARKPGQECVLAIEISRAGFEWALAHACLCHYTSEQHASHEAWAAAKAESPVRIQWDPDRSLTGERLGRRAIQIGLSGDAIRRYADDWACSISDITATVRQMEQLVRSGRIAHAAAELPVERIYPLDLAMARRIGADPGQLTPANSAGEVL